MNRVLAATRTDVALQARNQLYGISILFAAVMVGVLAWLSSPTSFHRTIPMAILFVVGGSTLLYVVAMVLLERDDGTLEAVTVSPLRPWEYLVAKVASLTALAVFEGAVLVGGTVAWLDYGALGGAAVPLVLLGLVALGATHVLIGVIIVVRFRRIMEALMPMGLIALVLQVPALYFVGALPSAVTLVIPSAPPAMFVRAAFTPLSPGELIYAVVGTLATVSVAAIWAHRAFVLHIVHAGVRP